MQGQALSWPRNNYHVDRVELTCSAIPNDIKYATYELANALANDTDAVTGNTGTGGLYEKVKLAISKCSTTPKAKLSGTVNNIFDIYPWLQSYLGAYSLGGSGSYQVRVVRADMALIDNVFKPYPFEILNEWGYDMTYVKAAATETYNATTGTISGTETGVTVKGIIMKLDPKEFRGEFQTTDMKVVIGNAELGDYYPNVRDRVRFTEAGETKEGRIIDVESFRGASDPFCTT